MRLVILCIASMLCACVGTVQDVQDTDIFLIDPAFHDEARSVSANCKRTLQDICSSGGNTSRYTAIIMELDKRNIKYDSEFIDIWCPLDRNIRVDIQGERDEIIYLTAHADKCDAAPWGNFASQLTAGLTSTVTSHLCLSDGALDNGVSCSVLIELADYFTKHKPHYSLRIMWFGAEESGLRGSKCHVAGLSWDEWDKVILCLNMDGAGGGDRLIYIPNDLPEEMHVVWLDSLLRTGHHLKVRHNKGWMPPIFSSDHASFEGSNLVSTLLGGCIWHAYGAVLPKADWLSLYKSSKPTIFLSSNSIKNPVVAITANILLLPISSLHGIGDDASEVNPIDMYKPYFATRMFVQKYRGEPDIKIISRTAKRTLIGE